MDFKTAAKQFATARNKGAGKRLENNTHLVKLDEETYGVKFHKTVVVQIHHDGHYTLNSGGYSTPTTKERIRKYSPARLFQKKHIWYLGGENSVHEFRDGIRIGRSGIPM